MFLMKYHCLALTLIISITSINAQEPLVMNAEGRTTISLNGKWQYLIDPYETGFYDYRMNERREDDPEAYWNTNETEHKSERAEFGFVETRSLDVPGDWNSQNDVFLYYEGTVWYRRTFDVNTPISNRIFVLHFGAANYSAIIYLNGKRIGAHSGGFTPFNFTIPAGVLKATSNSLVVKVDNKRAKDQVPTRNTDWWNYGGLTRDVSILIMPENFVRDYEFKLKNSANPDGEKNVQGWIRLNSPTSGEVHVEIPELKIRRKLRIVGDSISFVINLPRLILWSPDYPKLYDVVITFGEDRIKDRIGFRSIEVVGEKILLNGKPIFLRGICNHEEVPPGRRAYSKQDALLILGQAKSVNANMVRLAHYPHNENTIRVADSLGILLWSEIPVYWTIDFSDANVLNRAKTQLTEMIDRDRNRASVIIWSVGNETPVSKTRTQFMRELIHYAKELDPSRLVSAALEVTNRDSIMLVNDPLGEYTDIISVNEYVGWYFGLPSTCRKVSWVINYNKPFFISETGAEALGGFHADRETRWSEEFQEWYYQEQIEMFRKMPSKFVGVSPWILNDFRSPRRNNPTYQDGWNNKGLLDHQGNRKKAFTLLADYYRSVEQNPPYKNVR